MLRISKRHEPCSNVPNPLRTNYDYSNEKCGPEWQDRVKCVTKEWEQEKRRKNRKATLHGMFMKLSFRDN